MAGGDESVFVGGGRWPRTWRSHGQTLRWQGANATWPFVELRILDGRVSVRLRSSLLRRVLSRWMPTVEIQISETVVDPISGALPGSPGVRISTADNAGIIFWTFRRQQEVIGALLARGARLGESDVVF